MNDTNTYKLQLHYLQGFLNGYDKAKANMELNRVDIENKINNLNKLINNIPDDSKEINDNNKIINDLIIKKFEKIRNFEYILNNRNINFHQQSLINSNIMRLKNEVRILKSKISNKMTKKNEKINENITLDIEKK